VLALTVQQGSGVDYFLMWLEEVVVFYAPLITLVVLWVRGRARKVALQRMRK
jgi:hypothetical protein